MSSKLDHALALYFSHKGITNKKEKDTYTIKLRRVDSYTRSIFNVLKHTQPHGSFIVSKTDLELGDLLTIPKDVKRIEIDKYCVANIVSEYTQGFTHEDVGVIRICDNTIDVRINPESYFYKGTIKIRRV